MNISVRQYQEQAIQSMTQGELLLCVFDEAIKNMKLAAMMLGEGNYPTFEKCTEKCKRIFTYLSTMLDRSYPISMELYRMYEFIGAQIVRAEVKREEGVLEPLVSLVEELRETWAQADRLSHRTK